MRGLTRRLRLVVMIAGTALVMTNLPHPLPLWAAGDQTKPSVKELIKGAKERRAVETLQPEQLAGTQTPDDPLGRQTPRSAVKGFLKATRERDYATASEYLDLRNLPPGLDLNQGPDLARQFKIILDRALFIDLELLSSSPEGDRQDNLPAGRERVGRLAAGDKSYDILLQQVPYGDGAHIWKFASTTTADIPALYKEYGYGPLERFFPAWMFDYSILGIHLWQWVLTVTVLLLLYPVATWITWLGGRILRLFSVQRAENLERFFAAPLKLLVWILLARALSPLIGPSVAFSALMQVATIPLFALAWLLIRLVDFGASRILGDLDRRGLAGARVLVTPVSRLVKLVVMTGIMLLWLDNMGFKVTTLLAGLSISGVAVALASQKSLENIFGALTLFSSQPVRVGDFCRFGDQVGTVEEIGLRATRIRTLDRSLITVANGEFANLHLDNYSVRDRFWYHPQIGLRYETTPDQIRYILVEVQMMLYAHPKVLPEPLWVRFLGFGDYSLNVGVFAYIGVTDYTESLEIAEDLNLRIMDIVAAAGSDFAFPAQIQYELPGKPVDESRVHAVEAQVKEWKAQRALYLPNLPKEKITEIRGSLAYPPPGSPGAVPTSS